MADITGTNFDDQGDNALYGTADADTLNGLAGADAMYGGGGYDTYIVDNVGDTTSEYENGVLGGIDQVYASASHTLGYGIEWLTLTGSGNSNGTGNEIVNTIIGNSGNNVLKGLAGNDTLIGGDGRDLLDGGTGIDTMDGGFGNDTYIVNNAADVAKEVYNTTLGGVDTVKSSVSYTLSAAQFGIENLTLTGTAAINGTGNANHNVLTGNNANNSLYGGDGDDTLIGGSGKDTLWGGTGYDTFKYNSTKESPYVPFTTAYYDVIKDFKGNGSLVGDKIDLKTIDANTGVADNQQFKWNGSTAGGAGTLWYKSGFLYGNVDSDATAELQIKVELSGAAAPVHVSDIVL